MAASMPSWRCPHPLPHLIECAAMVLMLALPAAVASTGHRGHRDGGMSAVTGTAARFSPLTLLLALFMVGYVMWLGNNLTALAPGPHQQATTTTTGNRLPGPQVRRLLQDRHGHHHGLHADHDAVARR